MAIAPRWKKTTSGARGFDMRALWVLCGWGSAAALALLDFSSALAEDSFLADEVRASAEAGLP